MNRSAAAGGNIRSVSKHESVEMIEPALARPTVLVATAELVISGSMRDLLYGYPLKTVWARGVEEVRAVLARETVAACFCGFWLIDGTYREIVRLLKRQPVQIPAIIVCAPSCPQEYRDYLAALTLRAFDFLCHPYRKRIWNEFFGPPSRSAGSPFDLRRTPQVVWCASRTCAKRVRLAA